MGRAARSVRDAQDPRTALGRVLPRAVGRAIVDQEQLFTVQSDDYDVAPDGRFLAFSESVSMETGMFAYYDLEKQEYVAWDESLGRASWSPDGNLLTYDRTYYVYTGEERLYLRPRQGGEQLIGPDYEGPAFASQPVFSPAGDQIAYIAKLDGPMTDMATIMVLDLAGGEPKSLEASSSRLSSFSRLT